MTLTGIPAWFAWAKSSVASQFRKAGWTRTSPVIAQSRAAISASAGAWSAKRVMSR
ncbi:hypothetical protein IVB30_31955 [Bradyrhizobium sp. 200]|uniref:hypothetical protein n=1 Tax=Bradyrhizobium sp. 200 TaxID=2782665 RepID=UPI0020003E45|nr:hypothetical protein [Bradyrhizobium sp. 200]UPJ47796.1 hypothetical protein IVB30_31955 [Bradyrhizobium sp. 200]